MKKTKNITLKEIAEKIGVSKVTVSKALRDHPDISKARIKEVKEISSKLGYIPNFAARNLSAKKTRTIGVVVPTITNTFFSKYIESIYNCAFEKNYDIILAVSQENSKKEMKHLETMLSMNVDGIIISIVEHSENKVIFDRISSSEIPLVFFDRIIKNANFSSVVLANKNGSYELVEMAIKKGYKKIGHFGGWQDSNIGKERYLGYKNALKKNKIALNEEWVIISGFEKNHGHNSFMKLYQNNNLPEIIFAVTFPVALGILEAATNVGVKIPEDLDIICFGDSELNNYIKPKISCVIHDTDKFAKETFNLILKQINSNDKLIDENLEIKTEVLIKETCDK